MKNIKLILLLVLSAVIILIGYRITTNPAIPGLYFIQDIKTMENGKPEYLLYGNRSIGQSFIANFDGLSRIQLMIFTENNGDKKTIYFHLKTDPKAANDIASVKVDLSGATEDDGINIDFKKIPGSKNRHYYFYVAAPNMTVNDKIKVFYALQNNMSNSRGTMTIGHRPAKGALIFNSYFYMKKDIRGIAEDFWAHLNEDRPFTAAYAFMLALIFIGLIVLRKG